MKREEITDEHKKEIKTLIGYGYTLSAILNLYPYPYKDIYDLVQEIKGGRKNESEKG